jgi:hypothetical protein
MMKDPDNWDESFNTMSLFVWWWGLIAIFTASTTMMSNHTKANTRHTSLKECGEVW